MSEHFISRNDAETDLLSGAAFLAERIKSSDGHAEAMLTVVPQYLAKGNVDLAAELSNTVDDPFTRDRLLTLVAEKCGELDDDEYALQLIEAIEDDGLRAQALERVASQHAVNGKIDAARRMSEGLLHPDAVLVAIAAKQAADGLDDEALQTIGEIDYAGAAVTAFHEIANQKLEGGDRERAAEFLERASEEASDIEHSEEKARAYCDIANAFVEAARNDRAIENFDKAKSTAETIDNMHRDSFLALAAQGFLHAGSIDLADRTLDLVGDKTSIAACLLGYARDFWRKDERQEAIDSLEESYAILESQHERETRDSRSRFRLFTQIAAQFAGFEKGERAIEIAEKIKDETEKTSALTQVAAILSLRKEDDEARHAYRAIVDDGDRVFALIGMSDAKERNGDRDAAVELLREAEHLAETVPQLSVRATAYSEIARRLAAFGDSSSAGESIHSSIETIGQIRDESSRASSLARLAEIVDGAGIELDDSLRTGLQSLVSRQSM